MWASVDSSFRHFQTEGRLCRTDAAVTLLGVGRGGYAGTFVFGGVDHLLVLLVVASFTVFAYISSMMAIAKAHHG